MASVPSPLSTARVSGYDFGTPCPPGGWAGTGECFGWANHLGSDIGTKAGEAIVAPFDSTATFQTGLTGYGNLLTEQFANGWKLLFGHVASGISGPVRAGQQIGVTGRDIGSAIGSVTLLEAINPQGQHVNPDPILQGFLSGLDTGQPSGPNWPAGFDALVKNLQAAPAEAAKNNANIVGAIGGIPTQIGHGLADFLVVGEQDIAEWLKRQTVAFFVAAIVLLVLFWQ